MHIDLPGSIGLTGVLLLGRSLYQLSFTGKPIEEFKSIIASEPLMKPDSFSRSTSVFH
jgi:hypothetical protein